MAIALHPEVEVTITLNIARSADEAERQAKGEMLTTAEAIYGDDINENARPENFFDPNEPKSREGAEPSRKPDASRPGSYIGTAKPGPHDPGFFVPAGTFQSAAVCRIVTVSCSDQAGCVAMNIFACCVCSSARAPRQSRRHRPRTARPTSSATAAATGCTSAITTQRAERAIVLNPSLAVPEAYMDGELDFVEGDVLGLLQAPST